MSEDALRYAEQARAPIPAEDEVIRSSKRRQSRPLGWRLSVPFIIFLGVLGVFYIGLRNYYDRLWRQEQALEEEVRNLHSESTTLSAELMLQSKESEVVRLVKSKSMDLEESTTPPVKVEYKKR